MESIENRFGLPSRAPADAGDPGEEDAVVEQPTITGQTVISRRTALRGGVAGLAGLGALALFPGQLLAAAAVPSDPFMILLKGKYRPLVNPPNLHLTKVKLNDGSFSTVKIYPQKGVPDHTDTSKAIGNFYVQFAGDLCAYNLPKGSLVMRFDKNQPMGDTIPDGSGGNWLVGNINLTILEGTGIYRSFVGGHNFMVDILHELPNKTGYVENCVCIISRP